MVPKIPNTPTTTASDKTALKHTDFACFFGKKELLPDPARPDKHDFLWSSKEEPHFHRRKEILKKYPEIQKLFGHEPLTKWIILGIVATQLFTAWLFRDSSTTGTWLFWLAAYVIGGTCNQALFLGIHELSHNLGFKGFRANKLYSILVANVPIALPYAASFKPYHMEHHKYQGLDGVDTDVPTNFEAKLFQTIPGKLFFTTFQVFFYALRPLAIRVHPLTWYHLLNVVYIFAFDYLLYKTMGIGAVYYLLASTLLAGSGLHPCASHFFAEHYVITNMWETYSYYGWLNFFCFNVGYHNEHHDFPNIAWSKLPLLRKLAAEYYDYLPYHESWPLVTWKFIFDDRITVWNRVKRKNVKLSCDGNSDETVLLNTGLKPE